MAAIVCFEKRLGGAGREGKRGVGRGWLRCRVNRGRRAGVGDTGEIGGRAGPGRGGGPVTTVGVLKSAGKSGRAVMGHRQAGPSNTVPGRLFKQYFEQILNLNVSNKFQTVSNFSRLEKYFLGLRKIEMKYDFEDLEEMNNFIYRNFLIFRIYLE
jgi:hypothetical protein